MVSHTNLICVYVCIYVYTYSCRVFESIKKESSMNRYVHEVSLETYKDASSFVYHQNHPYRYENYFYVKSIECVFFLAIMNR